MRHLNRSGKRQRGVSSGRTVLGLCTSAIIVVFVGFVVVQLAFLGAANSSKDADNTLVVSQHTSWQAELVAWESESQGLDEKLTGRRQAAPDGPLAQTAGATLPASSSERPI